MEKTNDKEEAQVEEVSEGKQKVMEQLRHQTSQKYERQEYLRETGLTEATGILRMRLEVEDVRNNQGKGRRKCE